MTTEMINSSEVAVPSTQTSVYEAIFGRRMSKEFTDADVPREALERMLDAAIWAPNHRLTEPWRFFVLEKDSPAREQIADLVWQYAYDNVASPNVDDKGACGGQQQEPNHGCASACLCLQCARSE